MTIRSICNSLIKALHGCRGIPLLQQWQETWNTIKKVQSDLAEAGKTTARTWQPYQLIFGLITACCGGLGLYMDKVSTDQSSHNTVNGVVGGLFAVSALLILNVLRNHCTQLPTQTVIEKIKTSPANLNTIIIYINNILQPQEALPQLTELPENMNNDAEILKACTKFHEALRDVCDIMQEIILTWNKRMVNNGGLLLQQLPKFDELIEKNIQAYNNKVLAALDNNIAAPIPLLPRG